MVPAESSGNPTSSTKLLRPFAVVAIAALLIGIVWTSASPPNPFFNQHRPQPTLTQKWSLPPLERVFLTMEPNIHYGLSSEEADAAWNSSLPSGGGLLYLPSPDEDGAEDVYSVSMFHQIRCLNYIRLELEQRAADRDRISRSHNSTNHHVDLPPPSKLAHHCMNYMRQMILCNADFRLQSCRKHRGFQITQSYITHTCNDWSAVYEATEDNYQLHMARSGPSH